MGTRRGRASGGRASGGRARSRRDEYEDEDDDRGARGARGRGPQGPNMPLIIGSVVGLIALLGIGGFMMSSVDAGREADMRRRAEEKARADREREEKQAALEDKQRRLEEDKMKREGPWKLALEKILAPLKKWMNKDNEVKRIIGTFGFENDRAEFHFKIRPKWNEVDSAEREATATKLCDKVAELCANGFDHCKDGGYPMSDDAKVILIHFWDPPADPDAPKSDMGREVATWRNGSLSFK